MPTIPANIGPTRCAAYGFRPNGGLKNHGVRMNPAVKFGADVDAALITVGLTSQDEATRYKVDAVIEIVRAMREKQIKNPDSTFITQRGLFKHQDGRVVDENGVRVIILKLPGSEKTLARFTANMIKLAEKLARELNQEMVILETQHNGVTTQVYGVTA